MMQYIFTYYHSLTGVHTVGQQKLFSHYYSAKQEENLETPGYWPHFKCVISRPGKVM